MKLKELLEILDSDEKVFVYDNYSAETLAHDIVPCLPEEYNDCEVVHMTYGSFVNVGVNVPRTYSSGLTFAPVFREWNISFSHTDDMLDVRDILESDWSESVFRITHDGIANMYFICSGETLDEIEKVILHDKMYLQKEEL